MVDSVSSGVDSYQIPVPNGDCAFHFLVDRSQGVGNFVIEKAIIVDGGRGADEACKVIKDTLAQLQDDKYGKRDIVFDYWLVTHWDEDHYAGALEYFDKLDDEKRKQFKGVYGPVSVSKEELGMENKDHQQVSALTDTLRTTANSDVNSRNSWSGSRKTPSNTRLARTFSTKESSMKRPPALSIIGGKASRKRPTYQVLSALLLMGSAYNLEESHSQINTLPGIVHLHFSSQLGQRRRQTSGTTRLEMEI